MKALSDGVPLTTKEGFMVLVYGYVRLLARAILQKERRIKKS